MQQISQNILWDTQRNTVLKLTKTPQLEDKSFYSQYKLQMEQNELEALKQSGRHKNILNFQDYIPQIYLNNTQYSAICYQKAKCDLWDYLFSNQQGKKALQKKRNFPSIKEKIKFVKKAAIQILSALKHLHSKRISHNDIKLENILVFGKETMKICDFGLANTNQQFQQEDKESYLNEWSLRVQGKVSQYLAPEIINQIKSNIMKIQEGKATSNEIDMDFSEIKGDIFSFGCLIFCAVFGHFPKNGEKYENDYFYSCVINNDIEDIIQKLKRYDCHSELFNSMNEIEINEMMDFIFKCISYKPCDRFSAEELKCHQFLKQ